QVTSGLADIRGGVTAFEEGIQSGRSATEEPDPEDIGLQDETARCTISTDGALGDADGQEIKCTLKGNPKVVGKEVILTRNSSGSWNCTSDVDAKYMPSGCN